MSSTIRDEDTALLGGSAEQLRIGHFYLDVSVGKLHSLNDDARRLRASGVPLLASDAGISDLRDERGTAVTADELPLLVAVRERRPVEAAFLLERPGQADRRLHYSATPLRDSAGKVGAIVVSVVCQPAVPDWALLAGLAHDLRTPLQALQMLRHVLEFRTLPEAQRQDALDRLGGAAERTLQIAQELLDWCRTRGARQDGPHRDWFALEPVLREVFGEQAPAAAEKGLKLDTTLGAVRGWQVHSERGRLARIVANLLVNAVRYTPAGGHVNLGAAWQDHDGARLLVVEVRDTGAGIAPHEQESIFQAFERGQTGRNQDANGSGVGLSVVERLTQELGLRCDVSSSPGTGSQFRIHIPQPLLRMAPAETASRPAR